MKSEQEAQQAQTIAEIKAAAESYKLELREYDLNTRQTDEVFVLFEKAMKIVDSQAQKIAEQAKEIERLKFKVKATELRSEHG